MATWLPSEIIENFQWSQDLYSLKIRTGPINYSPGQFVNVGLEIDDKLLARPYSLITTPQDEYLEIHFNQVKEGILSPKLAELQAGDSIQVSDRTGGLLTLNEIPEVPFLWFIATGTGIGPFLSLLDTPELWARFERITLCYSVKYSDKLAYRDVLEKYQAQHPKQFSFLPFVTQEDTAETIHSRITDSIVNGELEKRVQLNLEGDLNHVMLCGNTKMITEVTTLLEKKGLRRHTRREPGHIAIEKYY